MSRKLFTEEQLQVLRQNPYVYSVTDIRLTLTKEFKERFLIDYRAGKLPRKILEEHGFDAAVLGNRRIWDISYHIREEYRKYGEFHEGYGPRESTGTMASVSDEPRSEAEELQQLRHEVEYLKQEMEFLKKISLIKSTRK